MSSADHDHARAHRIARRWGAAMHGARAWLRRRPVINVLYQSLITLLGVLIIVAGIILLPLPGPGWLVIFLGLAVLGSEYHWARRLLGWLRQALAKFWHRWHRWRAARRERRAARA